MKEYIHERPIRDIESCCAARTEYPDLADKVAVVMGGHAGLGHIALDVGDVTAADPLFQECLDTANRLKDHHLGTVSRQGLGWCALLRSEWEAARQYFEESLAIPQKAGRPMWSAFDCYSLGAVAIGQGNLELARYHLQEALDLARRIEDVALIVDSIRGLAELFSRTGKLPEAVQLRAFVSKYPASVRPVRGDYDLQSQLAAMLSPEVYLQAVRAGQMMTLEEAILLAREQIGVE